MTLKRTFMFFITAAFMIAFALFAPARVAAQSAQQQQAVDNVRARYTKYEYRIPDARRGAAVHRRLRAEGRVAALPVHVHPDAVQRRPLRRGQLPRLA